MNDPFLMRLHNIFRQQKPLGNIFADLAGHIIPLHAVHGRIFVGIFLFDFLIVAFDQAEDLFVRGIGFSHQCTFIAVGNIISGNVKGPLVHNLIFHKILNLFYGQRAPHPFTDLPHIV